MNRRLSKTLSLVFAFTVMTSISIASEVQKGERQIASHTLPVPVGASSVIQEAVLNAPSPNAKPAKKSTPQTKEEWKAWAAKINTKAAVGAQALAKELKVSVRQGAINGVNVYRLTPAEIDPKHKDHLFVYLHGGAYVLLGGEAGIGEAVLVAARTRMPVISVDFRMPPEHPAPAAIDDVVTVWKHLLKSRSASSMALGGSSSGGGLTIASIHRFKELKLSLPGALYLGTPAVEVDKIGDSRYINEGADRLLASWDGVPHKAFSLYASDYDHKHPYVSPIYGDFEDFPPSYLISGTRDLLLSDTIRTHRKLRAAGVDADLNVYEGLSHREYIVIPNAPESLEHYGELNAFLLEHLTK
ncbi:MAG: alpha/beta hydrolase fold domain-containing protein [Campylobacterota bacterium]|nr:alpha/beta hydrolase fold domain-containing protein [Campylobacterota bacterium]